MLQPPPRARIAYQLTFRIPAPRPSSLPIRPTDPAPRLPHVCVRPVDPSLNPLINQLALSHQSSSPPQGPALCSLSHTPSPADIPRSHPCATDSTLSLPLSLSLSHALSSAYASPLRPRATGPYPRSPSRVPSLAHAL
jgi:hypothetical protein